MPFGALRAIYHVTLLFHHLATWHLAIGTYTFFQQLQIAAFSGFLSIAAFSGNLSIAAFSGLLSIAAFSAPFFC